MCHIKSKENLAGKGSRFSAYKEMYLNVIENKKKMDKEKFFYSENFMFVENCLADNTASVFIRRKKRSFFNFFIKEYVGINVEKYEKDGKLFNKVFFYNKNNLTHKVHYSLLFSKKTDLEVINEVLKNNYTKKYKQIMFKMNSDNDFIDLLY